MDQQLVPAHSDTAVTFAGCGHTLSPQACRKRGLRCSMAKAPLHFAPSPPAVRVFRLYVCGAKEIREARGPRIIPLHGRRCCRTMRLWWTGIGCKERAQRHFRCRWHGWQRDTSGDGKRGGVGCRRFWCGADSRIQGEGGVRDPCKRISFVGAGGFVLRKGVSTHIPR